MKGLIAFFDILGYQSFLENNSATESALEVLDLITAIPLKAKQDTENIWKTNVAKGQSPEILAIGDNLKHVIFSDTIVLIVPYPDEVSEGFRSAAIAFLTIGATQLSAAMFSKGLPLRGVIHEGDYVLKDTCFAGSGIVQAYRLCSQLDFAGFVISPELNQYIESRRKGAAIFTENNYGTYFVSVLTPLKNNIERPLTHTNWLHYLSNEELSQIENDVIQAVMRAFWAHGKDCGREVDAKVRNTCKMMRRLLVANEKRTKSKESNGGGASAERKPM